MTAEAARERGTRTMRLQIQRAHACDGCGNLLADLDECLCGQCKHGPETVRGDAALQKRMRMIQADIDVQKLIAEFQAALAVGEGY